MVLLSAVVAFGVSGTILVKTSTGASGGLYQGTIDNVSVNELLALPAPATLTRHHQSLKAVQTGQNFT